jgi:hypothetical protein
VSERKTVAELLHRAFHDLIRAGEATIVINEETKEAFFRDMIERYRLKRDRDRLIDEHGEGRAG